MSWFLMSAIFLSVSPAAALLSFINDVVGDLAPSIALGLQPLNDDVLLPNGCGLWGAWLGRDSWEGQRGEEGHDQERWMPRGE